MYTTDLLQVLSTEETLLKLVYIRTNSFYKNLYEIRKFTLKVLLFKGYQRSLG